MKRNRLQPEGTIYLIVMATVAVVVTLSVTGLTLVRVQRKASEMTVDLMDARAGALTAVDYGAGLIELSPTWRTQAAAANGVLASLPFGRGKIEVKLTDPVDGDLANSASDAVNVTGTGRVGTASQAWRARLTPTYLPMSCLGAGIVVAGDVHFDKGVLVGTDRLSGSDQVDSKNSRIQLPVEAVGAITGSSYSATSVITAGRQVPDATIFALYKAMGSQITSSGMSGRRIENVLISPQSNPYGSKNANGIYWLDCQGDEYTIQNCRIVGTLILLNCTGAHTDIAGSVNWEPAVSGLPALIVQGKIDIQATAANLSESSVGVNFNPASTPYMGQVNATTNDVYPSQIKGLIYVSNDLKVSGEAIIDGVLVVGHNLDVKDAMLARLLYDDRYYYSPPIGFRASTVMTLVPGSFTQQVN